MKTKIKQEKGITLIALVITIVVLLILAGVSINAIFSENGIINKAKDAQNKMDQATQNDLDAINDLDNAINKLTGETTEEKVPDILERYILGEDKKGILATTIIDTSNAPTSFKFIGNEIIPDAETSIEFKEFIQDGNDVKILFEYKNNYYTATADTTTYMTKTVYIVKKIFDGDLTLGDDPTTITGITEMLSMSKQYKVEYMEDGETKIGVAHTKVTFGAVALSIQNDDHIPKFYLIENLAIKYYANSIIIKRIYEIGDATNCVEENGFVALLDEEQNEWELCGSPDIEYNIPKTVKGKEISCVLMDCLQGTPIFTEKISISGTGEPIYLKKIIIKIPDENFISKFWSLSTEKLQELDLSECGNNIEIPIDYITQHSDLKIYVSSEVKANYEAYDNVVAK